MFAVAKGARSLFSAWISAAAGMFATPELESAWVFAFPFAVGQMSGSTELASLMFFAAGKTLVLLESESALFFAAAAAVATGETPLSAQLMAAASVSAWATEMTSSGYTSFGRTQSMQRTMWQLLR